MAEATEAPAEVVETTTDASTTTAPVKELPATVSRAEYEAEVEKRKAANAESAARRKELDALRKEKADREAAEMTELERAKLEAAAHQTKAAEYEKELAALKVEKALGAAEKKLSITWANDTAREDAINMIGAVAPEDVEKELKRVTTARPHWLKTTTAPNLDATESGKQTTPDDKFLAEIAKRYNIRG